MVLEVSVAERVVPEELDVSVALVELLGLVELATRDESVLEDGGRVEFDGSSSRLVVDGLVALEVAPFVLLRHTRCCCCRLTVALFNRPGCA